MTAMVQSRPQRQPMQTSLPAPKAEIAHAARRYLMLQLHLFKGSLRMGPVPKWHPREGVVGGFVQHLRACGEWLCD